MSIERHRDAPYPSEVNRPGGWGLTFVVFLACTGAHSCTPWQASVDPPLASAESARRPIYFEGDVERIVSLPPREVVERGRRATSSETLYLVDVGTGVHVLDNANPRSPVAVAFLQIFGATSIELRGERLVVNNYSDLVTLDVSDPGAVIVVERDPGLFGLPDESPPNHSGYFECYDPARGHLVGWEAVTLTDPECRTF